MKFYFTVMLLMSSLFAIAQPTAEEQTFINWLDEEERGYMREPLVDFWKKHWVFDEQTRLNVRYADGSVRSLDKDMMLSVSNIVTGDSTAIVKRDKFKFTILEDRAFLSYTSTIFIPGENVTIISNDFREFKKIDGAWRSHIFSRFQKLVA
jgi:hypothetical protein